MGVTGRQVDQDAQYEIHEESIKFFFKHPR